MSVEDTLLYKDFHQCMLAWDTYRSPNDKGQKIKETKKSSTHVIISGDMISQLAM